MTSQPRGVSPDPGKLLEDTSLEDFVREMDALRSAYRTPFRLWLRFLWQDIRCAVLGHRIVQHGAKYWTDYGYEYDAWYQYSRCGEVSP